MRNWPAGLKAVSHRGRGQQKAEGLEKSQGVERKGPNKGMYEIEGRGGANGDWQQPDSPSCCIRGAQRARLLCCARSQGLGWGW